MDANTVTPEIEASAAHIVPQSRQPVEAELSDLEIKILDFERAWWQYAGAKEQAIKDLFGMSATRYYQALNSLLDKQAALAVDPLLIKRLRRLRTSRQQQRSARRVAGGS